MTTAFAALLIGVAGAALLLALAGYLWVNRTPSTNERFDRYGRVPLFGVDLGNVSTPIASAQTAIGDEEDDDQPTVSPKPAREVKADRATAAADSSVQDAAAVQSLNGDHSSFAPPAPKIQADTPPSNGAVGHLDDDILPINRTPSREARPVRGGWGATPGWPVAPDNGLAPTPKYVPPVIADAPHGRPVASASIANGNGVMSQGVQGSMIEGHQLRFSTPAEGTLQFLPGRLEISTGLDNGREIRFVRVPGPNGTEVTFGRNEGPLYRHIQLRDQTVSREHARLLFADGQWTLTNLSKTNPVAHNGRILRLAEEQPLSDGDRLEMGEVVFSFRSR